MITTLRTTAAAAAAALALVGGAALAGTAATAGDGRASLPQPSAARTLVSSCDGGPTVSMHRRATDFQSIPAGTTADVEGSAWTVRGPKRGTDAVVMTLSSMASSGGAGELTTVQLYKDGVGTPEGSKYYTYNNVLDQASVQFCVKLPHGQHEFVVKVTAGGGGATTMYYPGITYERFS